MNNTLEEKQKRLAVIVADLSAKSALPDDEFIGEKGAALTEAIKNLDAEADALQKEIAAALEAKNILRRNADRQIELSKATNVQVFSADIPKPDSANDVVVKSVRGQKSKHFDTAEDAFLFAKFMQAALTDNYEAKRFCDDYGLQYKAMSGTSNPDGGVLIPPQFLTPLIALRQTYGVFEKYAQRVNMTSDTASQTKVTGEVTSYYVGQNSPITESAMTFGLVDLVVKKLAVFAILSNELNSDASVNIGDTLAKSIAYQSAVKIDQAAFNGDGTSTYGGIVGAREALKNLGGTFSSTAGLQVGSGNAYSELTLLDFQGVVGRLPDYAMNAAWFVSKKFYNDVMSRLMLSSGTATTADIAKGTQNLGFLNYPVVFTNAMPKVEANSQVCALLADFSVGAMFGERQSISIASSNTAGSAFQNDQTYVRGILRYDINIHDVGNYTSTAADQQAGAVCGLITAAS